MLETDPEAVLTSENADALLLVVRERLMARCDMRPTEVEALVLEALDPLLRDWLKRNLGPLVKQLVEA